MRVSVYFAAGSAALIVAAPASAQSLGDTIGAVTEPVVQAAKPVAQAAQKTAEPVVKATRPVTQAAEPVVEAARPVTDTATSAVGGTGGGAIPDDPVSSGGSASTGSSSTGNTEGESAAQTSRTRYVVINGKKCKRGEKRASAALGARTGGANGPGSGPAFGVAAASAERSLHTALAKQRAEERAAKDRSGDALGARADEDSGGLLSIPGIGDPDDFSLGTGIVLLALFGLGVVGVVAGVTSHVLGRVRSS